jgi:hypothetical protein
MIEELTDFRIASSRNLTFGRRCGRQYSQEASGAKCVFNSSQTIPKYDPEDRLTTEQKLTG